MPSLKILIALQYYVPHRTGLTLHVQRIAEGLVRRGHSVTILTARFRKDLKPEEMIDGVRVVRLWAPIRVSRGMVMPLYAPAAVNLAMSHDVVSIHTPMLETALFAAVVRMLGKGLLITHHGDLILPSGWVNRFVMWVTYLLFKIAGHAASHIIAYSDDYAANSYYLSDFRAKTKAVYPPIVVNSPDASQVRRLRAKWLAGTSGASRLIGYAGRFVEEKRPDILIESLATVHREYPGTRIVFAGEYDVSYESFYQRHSDLLNKYRDSLIFLGLLNDEQEIADFYAACDVLALPSDTECFALVQVEAMRSGTPVVATNIPGAREVVRVTGMGQLVPPRDPMAMGTAIVQVMKYRSRFLRSLTDIDTVFSFNRTLDEYERLLADARRN